MRLGGAEVLAMVGFVVGALLGASGLAVVWYASFYSEESLHGAAGIALCLLVAPTTGIAGSAVSLLAWRGVGRAGSPERLRR